MSRSFKKNTVGYDYFPGPRKFFKKVWKKKIRNGKDLSYNDTKVNADKFFMKIENYMGPMHHFRMK